MKKSAYKQRNKEVVRPSSFTGLGSKTPIWKHSREKVIRTEKAVHAPRSVVWRIMTELDEYPQWNPFIPELKGRLEPGSPIQASIHAPGEKKRIFKGKINTIDPFHELTWTVWIGRTWLFEARYSLQLQELGPDSTRVIHVQEFRGPLVHFYWLSLNTAHRNGIEEMNRALKRRAERFVRQA